MNKNDFVAQACFAVLQGMYASGLNTSSTSGDTQGPDRAGALALTQARAMWDAYSTWVQSPPSQ